eukprot:m.25399 g.25399  ORF g.25399 m.25399 type:complete len:64 (-) comp13182_c1_seq1:15-206(-)
MTLPGVINPGDNGHELSIACEIRSSVPVGVFGTEEPRNPFLIAQKHMRMSDDNGTLHNQSQSD